MILADNTIPSKNMSKILLITKTQLWHMEYSIGVIQFSSGD